MSEKFNARIRSLRRIQGGIKGKVPELKAVMHQKEAYQAKITASARVKAKIKDNILTFSGKIKEVLILYRWLEVARRLMMTRRSDASIAPASDTVIDNTSPTSHRTEAASEDTSEITAKKRVSILRLAKAAAYIRAVPITVKRIFLLRRSGAISADGMEAISKKITPLILTRKALGADSESIKGKRTVCLARNADAGTGMGQDAEIDRMIVLAGIADMNAGGTTRPNISRMLQIKTQAAPSLWDYPQKGNGVLYLKQAYNATTEGTILKVE